MRYACCLCPNDYHSCSNDCRSYPNDFIRIQMTIIRIQTIDRWGSLGKSGNDYERRPGLRLPTRKPKANIVNVSFFVVSTEDFRRP